MTLAAIVVAVVALGGPAALRAGGPSTRPNPGRVRLLLPPVIYAVPGVETNLYFDNVVLVLDPDDYAFDAVCAKGKQMTERWTFAPEAGDVGDHPLEVIVRDESNAPIARAATTVRVTPVDRPARDPATLLLVGASLTEYSIYPRHLLDLDAADPHLNLKLIGSRGGKDGVTPGPLRHEGYSGWTAEAFRTTYGPLSRQGVVKRPGTGSPFLYKDDGDAEPRLDFGRYCREFNGGRGPDLITIQLIVNDVFREDDATIDGRIDRMIGHFDALIDAFHRVRPDTRVGVVLTAPSSRSQDGFRNYNRGGDRQTRWQVRRNMHRAWERLIERYGGDGGDASRHVDLVPSYVNLDTERAFPTHTAPAHARSSEELVRVSNGTHPNDDGYRQIGDSIYCWLKAAAPPAAPTTGAPDE